jgi:serine phosphatase RsbU (regulator of sigma subunit)
MTTLVGAARQAFRNDPHCGDDFHYRVDESEIRLCLVDGLGHGKKAAVAAQEAVAYVEAHPKEPLPALFTGCNNAIQATRGVAMGIVVVDRQARRLTFGAVGNIRCAVVGARTTRLMGSRGIVGAGFNSFSTDTLALNPLDLVVLFTDGLPSNLQLSRYSDSPRDRLGELAGQILHEWNEGKDDAAVLICCPFAAEAP